MRGGEGKSSYPGGNAEEHEMSHCCGVCSVCPSSVILEVTAAGKCFGVPSVAVLWGHRLCRGGGDCGTPPNSALEASAPLAHP